MRASGILLPVSSLPGAYGIGSFSREAHEFVDRLAESAQSYWQILPLGPTGYGDSPYQPFSTFAGNPYFISIEKLFESGLLDEEEKNSQLRPENNNYIDYGDLYKNRWPILRAAFKRFDKSDDFYAFCEKNAYWLRDYALYRTLKAKAGGAPWYDWDDKYKFRDREALDIEYNGFKDDIDFYCFLEYEFERQWHELKAYANKKGIRIIGDIPIYVAPDSSDAWSRPELFKLDKDLKPTQIAGCPPDYFSPTGQLWGNPVYDWEYHKKTDYDWWIKRLQKCFEFYDVLRLDHFRGFASYYEIPYGSQTAQNGRWVKGPGMDLFNTIRRRMGEISLIAEDLGMLTGDVFELIEESGYPGMKVLQFAFGSGSDNLYLPHNYNKNCVVYTGTHDNETVMGWLASMEGECRRHVREYLSMQDAQDKDLAAELVRVAMASTAEICIIPFQDYLTLGNEARINTPATTGENWKWRMSEGCYTDEFVSRISFLTRLYGRAVK